MQVSARPDNEDMILSLIPRRCTACDRLLAAGDGDVHERCAELAAKIKEKKS